MLATLFANIFPAIGIIILGVLLRVLKVFDNEHVKGFEIFWFKVGLPCYLFSFILMADLQGIVNVSFVLAYLATFIVTFCLGMFLHKKSLIKQRISLSLTSSYSNTTLYSVPIILCILGDATAGIIANLLQVMVVQLIAIFIFTFLNHNKTSVLKILFKVICTPFVIMPFVGIGLNYFHLQSYVKYPYEITNIIGKSATGMALFIFGLNFSKIRFHDSIQKFKVLKIVLLKNFIHPLIALVMGHYIFHLEKYWLSSLVITASAPTAFLIYIISNQYNANDDAIKTGIILSSIISVFTIIVISIYIYHL